MKMSAIGLTLLLSVAAAFQSCRDVVNEDPLELPRSESPVYISEYMTAGGWVEVFNPADSAVDLRGYTLIVGGRKRKPAESSLGAGQYMLFADIRDMDQAACFYLKDGDGALVDIIESPKYKKNKSVVRKRLPDGSFETSSEERISPGYPNTVQGWRTYQASRRKANDTGVIVSEILAACDTAYKDPDGNFVDYVELHNLSQEAVDISGWGLSDKENANYLFRFPEKTVMEAGAYIVVNCSSSYKDVSDGRFFRAPFSIANGEDGLYLSDRQGHIIWEYCPVSSLSDQSLVSLDGKVYIGTPVISPGSANLVPGVAPIASIPSGQYDGVDTLKVEFFAGGGDIYYTTDGSAPSKSSKKYKEAFLLTKTTVIRTISVRDGVQNSPVTSWTYLVNEGHTLDVVSLVSSPDGLFSTGSGIYSNGPHRLLPVGQASGDGIPYPYLAANYWRKWVRQANLAYLPKHGQGFSIDCGASIFGGYSRINAKKSLKFKFKKIYGAPKLHYKVFENRDFSTYECLVMRTGGQDVYGTLIKDDLASYLMDPLIDVMATKPAVFYINGQYYGIYFMREKVNKHFIAAHYGIPSDDIDIIQGNQALENGSIKDWNSFFAYMKSHDLSKPECYEYVKEHMDVQSYVDWIIAETYIGNRDAGNVRVFRSPNLDNKWHWLLYDVDMGFNATRSDGYLIYYKPTPQKLHATDFIRALAKNKDFRALFLERLEYQMTYIWSKENVNAAIDMFVEQIDSEVERNQKRWTGTYQGWEGRIQGLRDYANGRQEYLKEQFGSNALLKSLFYMSKDELDRCFVH